MRRLAKALAGLAALLCVMTCPAETRAQGRSRILCYTCYDTDYFYLAAVVQKPNLAGKVSALFSDPVQDDAVAVFLQSGEEPAGPQRSPRSIEMAVSVAGGAQMYRGAEATPLRNFGDFLKSPEGAPLPFKFGVTRQGTINQPGGDTTGYTVEMAIPWAEVGGTPRPGQRMRFNVVAFSAAPGSSPLLSLAPGVRTPADAQNPSLWTEMVFVDAPVRTVASVPGAKVCSRVFTSRPIIDGVIGEGEWNTLTGFGFEEAPAGGTVSVAPLAGTARTRPTVALRKARLAIRPAGPPDRGAPPTRHPQPLPRLTLALYRYDFQADPRKAAPLQNVKTPDGRSLLADHPLEGCGPWFSYDRVDWHRAQLAAIRTAGIDVILPVYRAGVTDKQRYALRGLITLTGALRSMANNGYDYPLVGLYLDTTSLSDPKGGKPDLRSAAGQELLYAAIRDFFVNVPRAFRAAIPLSEQNGGGTANLVALSSATAFADLDQTFVEALRRRFRADFDADLLLLGGSDFKAKAPLDGYFNETRGHGFQMDESGWIKPASVGVGYDETLQPAAAAPAAAPNAPKPAPRRPRMDGDTYRGEWKQALSKKADWVILDGWNDYAAGAEVAPTLENGIAYSDITFAFTRAFAGTGAMRAAFVAHTIPGVAPAGAEYAVTLRVLNAGTIVWTPDQFTLVCRWERSGGGAAGAPFRIALPGPARPGQAFSLPATLPVPKEPGAYTLTAEMAQISKKGEVSALFSGLGSAPLRASVRVVAPGDPALPAWAATFLSTDLPTTLEAGGTYAAGVTLRNDGAQTWKRDGGRIAARVWRYISPINSTGEQEADEPMEMADASAPLLADVPPGHTVTLTVPITFSREDGAPLTAWSQSDNWTYQLRWEFSASDSGAEGAVTLPEAFALVDAEIGAQFTLDRTPREMPAERRIPVVLGLRNRGPQTWRKDVTRVGYHWYYLDGTEVIWQDETTPISQDIEPGGEVSQILAWVSAPPNDGTYWLVWDLKLGDTWVSTLPGARAAETLVHRVDVIRGRLSLVDLAKAYNLDGVSSETDRADGDFDGTGRSLPAEIVPPFAVGDSAPSTIWLPAEGSGLDSSRRISFQWGPKGEKEKNLVQCLGQRVSLADPRKAEVCKAVHLLAAATQPNITGAFTLVFEDGSQQFSSFPFSRWDAPPANGEETAFVCRYSRARSGDLLDKPVALYRYTVRVTEKKKLVAILLPNAPAIKIAAITLEK